MDTNSLELSQERPEESLSQELKIAKFRTFAKEHFQDSVKKEIDYLQYIKKSGQLYSFHLPDEKRELFIHFQAAPFFWLCDSPLIQKIEEWLKFESKGKSSLLSSYKSIKEFFFKWTILKSEQEKKYYALSTIKLIERDTNRNNVLNLLFNATILIYDRKIQAPDKAIEILDLALQIAEQLKLEETTKKDLLYIINIFSGFAFMKLHQHFEANQKFTDALRSCPTGLTAKYYLALSDKQMGNKETAFLLIGEIINHDKSLIKFAIDADNLPLLSFFVQNAVTYNIFNDFEFADMLDEIDTILSIAFDDKAASYEKLGSLILKLTDLRLKDFYTPEIQRSIDFFEKTCYTFTGNKNTIANFSRGFLSEKFDKIGQMILDSIKRKFDDENLEKLKIYDNGINDNLEAIKLLSFESEEIIKAHKKKQEEVILAVETKYNDAVTTMETRIENIHKLKKFNPQTTFNNSMLFNFIITLIVFIVGGFAGCYQGDIGNASDFRDVMGTVMVSGVKWGVLTFFLGTIIAVLSSGFTAMERTNERQRISKKIGVIKNQKEREIENTKKENTKKTKSIYDNFNERIESHKKAADTMRLEKEGLVTLLQNETDKKIEEYAELLNSVKQ